MDHCITQIEIPIWVGKTVTVHGIVATICQVSEASGTEGKEEDCLAEQVDSRTSIEMEPCTAKTKHSV